MTKLEATILDHLKTPMTLSELIKAMRTDYGVKKTIDRLVGEGKIKCKDFKYYSNLVL